MPKPPSPSCCSSLYGPMTLPTCSRGVSPMKVAVDDLETSSDELCAFMQDLGSRTPAYGAPLGLRNRIQPRTTVFRCATLAIPTPHSEGRFASVVGPWCESATTVEFPGRGSECPKNVRLSAVPNAVLIGRFTAFPEKG